MLFGDSIKFYTDSSYSNKFYVVFETKNTVTQNLVLKRSFIYFFHSVSEKSPFGPFQFGIDKILLISQRTLFIHIFSFFIFFCYHIVVRMKGWTGFTIIKKHSFASFRSL